MTWTELVEAREVWLGKRSRTSEWPARGVAIEGDFAGIQGYVFKPVPGARGAAKRLRGRSLQVSAITALVAEWVKDRLPGANIFYSAGGRFLVWAPPSPAWEKLLAGLQKQLDTWMGEQFRGEVVFHLAAAEFEDGKIPREQLGAKMAERRVRTLDYFLRNESGWAERNFLREPGERAFHCPACLTTADDPRVQNDEEDLKICGECDRDKRLGAKLAQHKKDAKLSPDIDGEVAFIDGCYTIGHLGLPAGVIHHMPRENGDAMTLENVAEKCKGTRKWLAYLRLDVDSVGQAFRDLKNDPMRVQSLSRLLHGFFCDRVQEMLSPPGGKYYWLYPVYGGGDDLFVIGPWHLAIDFATYLEREFHKATAGALSFSAGIA
jgi:CRISPR-associated protein Csm1